jgi:hypothetical protein
MLICIIALPVVFLLCNPLVEMGANDDWQYIHMSKVWAETGRLQYEGWTEAMVGPHAAWGALVIKLFGFSFSTMRLSMLPIGIGCALLQYRIARFLGISQSGAAFCSLSLILSPLFVPLATVFMTDISALCLFLLTLYCALRAMDSDGWRAGLWLFGVAVSGLAAGTVRQILWGAPILMIIAFGIVRRKNLRLLAAAAVMLLTVCAGVITSLHWLYAQPYTYREKLHVPHGITGIHFLMGSATFFILALALLCIPPLVYFLCTRIAWTGAKVNAIIATGLTTVAAIFVPTFVKALSVGNTVTKYGVLSADEVLVGDRPIIFSESARYWLGAAVTGLLLFAALELARTGRVWYDRNPTFQYSPRARRLIHFLQIAVPFGIAYAGVVILRSSYSFVTDRYLLPMLALSLLGLVAFSDQLPGKRLLLVAWIVLALLGSYAIVITHDAFRIWEARAEATSRLNRSGVARDCIMGGYEYDGWTELQKSNYIIPPDKLPPRHTPVEHFFFRSTPHVRPKFYVVLSKQSSLGPLVLDVPYRTWLPPRARQVLVQIDPHVSCPGDTQPPSSTFSEVIPSSRLQ